MPIITVSDYALEEAGEYGNSVHVEGVEPVQDYSYEEHLQQDPEPELEPELEPEQESMPEVDRFEEETSFEETSHVYQNSSSTTHEPQFSVEESIGEPEKLTYASIVSIIFT